MPISPAGPYLFGGRPSFGDFGLAAQIYESSLDPTPGAWIGSRTPRVLDWVQRMLWPRIEGDCERWADLEPTLMPLLKRQVGALFLPWSVANSQALAAGEGGVQGGACGANMEAEAPKVSREVPAGSSSPLSGSAERGGRRRSRARGLQAVSGRGSLRAPAWGCFEWGSCRERRVRPRNRRRGCHRADCGSVCGGSRHADLRGRTVRIRRLSSGPRLGAPKPSTTSLFR